MLKPLHPPFSHVSPFFSQIALIRRQAVSLSSAPTPTPLKDWTDARSKQEHQQEIPPPLLQPVPPVTSQAQTPVMCFLLPYQLLRLQWPHKHWPKPWALPRASPFSLCRVTSLCPVETYLFKTWSTPLVLSLCTSERSGSDFSINPLQTADSTAPLNFVFSLCFSSCVMCPSSLINLLVLHLTHTILITFLVCFCFFFLTGPGGAILYTVLQVPSNKKLAPILSSWLHSCEHNPVCSESSLSQRHTADVFSVSSIRSPEVSLQCCSRASQLPAYTYGWGYSIPHAGQLHSHSTSLSTWTK